MTVHEELLNSPPEKLVIDGVSKSFSTKMGWVQALDNVSLNVQEGEFICLVGPSGCGKSTLLNMIAGLERPDKGQITADGKVVKSPGSDRMVMFQESALFPWLDVMGNVIFGLKLKKNLSRVERIEIAEYCSGSIDLWGDTAVLESVPASCKRVS